MLGPVWCFTTKSWLRFSVAVNGEVQAEEAAVSLTNPNVSMPWRKAPSGPWHVASKTHDGSFKEEHFDLSSGELFRYEGVNKLVGGAISSRFDPTQKAWVKSNKNLFKEYSPTENKLSELPVIFPLTPEEVEIKWKTFQNQKRDELYAQLLKQLESTYSVEQQQELKQLLLVSLASLNPEQYDSFESYIKALKDVIYNTDNPLNTALLNEAARTYFNFIPQDEPFAKKKQFFFDLLKLELHQIQDIFGIKTPKFEGFGKTPDVYQWLNDIKKLKHQISSSSNLPDTKLENLLTLQEIEQCLNTSAPENLANDLKTILKKRWERIRTSTVDYVNSPTNLVNVLCLEIAQTIYPLPKTENDIDNLPEKEGPYFILMPTLEVSRDAYYTNIHNFSLQEIVLNDSSESFIHAELCLNRMAVSDEGFLVHTAAKNNQYPKLSKTEADKVINRSKGARAYYESIQKLNEERIKGSSLGAHLQRLTALLKRGGAHGGEGGMELNAAAAANVGIVEFCDFWNTLPLTIQNKFYNAYPGLENIVGRLMRPADENYTNVKYCVEIIAGNIDTLLSSNQSTIFSPIEGYYDFLQKEVTEKRRFLQQELKNPKAVITPTEVFSPQLYADFLSLSFEQMQKLNLPDPALFFTTAMTYQDNISIFNRKSDEDKKRFMELRFSNGMTPLFYFTMKGNLKLVQVCLESGADINAQQHSGETVLFWAVSNSKHEIAKFLLEKNADVSIQTAQGNNIFEIKVQDNTIFYSILEKLNEYDLKKQKECLRHTSYSSVIEFVYKKHSDHNQLKKLLTNSKIDIKEKILLAGKFDYKDLEEDLLKTATLTLDEQLYLAVLTGNTDKVSALIEQGADVNYHPPAELNSLGLIGGSMLSVAAQNDYSAVVKVLLQKNPDISLKKNQENILEFVLKNISKCKKYLPKLINILKTLPEHKLKELLTPSVFIEAAKLNIESIINYYCDAGLDINVKDNTNNTALHWALYKKHYWIVYTLIAKNPDLLIRNEEGETPFNIAHKNLVNKEEADPFNIAHQNNERLVFSCLKKIAMLNPDDQKKIIPSGINALDWASIYLLGPEIKEIFHVANLPLSKKLEFAIHQVVYGNKSYASEVEFLLTQNVPVNEKAFLDAADNEMLSAVVKRWVDQGGDINVESDLGETALFRAISHQNLEVVNYLLDKKASLVTKDDTNALHYALSHLSPISEHRNAIVSALLNVIITLPKPIQQKIFINGDFNGTVLYLYQHQKELFPKLLENFTSEQKKRLFNFKVYSDDGETLLLDTIETGNFRLLRQLLTVGPALSARNASEVFERLSPFLRKSPVEEKYILTNMYLHLHALKSYAQTQKAMTGSMSSIPDLVNKVDKLETNIDAYFAAKQAQDAKQINVLGKELLSSFDEVKTEVQCRKDKGLWQLFKEFIHSFSLFAPVHRLYKLFTTDSILEESPPERNISQIKKAIRALKMDEAERNDDIAP